MIRASRISGKHMVAGDRKAVHFSANRKRVDESGVALLIAIFVVLLVSAVALSLVISSGTESSLAGNYRYSTNAYYSAVAGIEEARTRLLPSNPNTITGNLTPLMTTAAVAIPPLGNISYLPTNQVVYITNPAAGEPVGAGLLGLYPDTELGGEALLPPFLPPAFTFINSIWAGAATTGPLYKWVRINAATKNSLQVNVDGTGVGPAVPNAQFALFYDGSATPQSLLVPTSMGPLSFPLTASSPQQALEVTALAVLPNGAQKLLQYVVAPVSYNLQFQGALTLAGTVGNFQGANSNPYQINGNDGSGAAPAIPGCTSNQPAKAAINVSTGIAGGTTTGLPQTNQDYVDLSLPRPSNYTGFTNPLTPTPNGASIETTTNTGALASTASLDQLLQTVQQNADAVLQPGQAGCGNPITFGCGTGWPSDMSATNPKVVYADGNFDLGPNTGYGILVVTGNFLYTGNSSWNGIILVVGDGSTTFLGNGGGSGEFNGAIFTATTRDSAGNQLANFGTVNFDINGGGGNGIYYNSCWIKKAQQPPKYQILSFREF